MKYHISGLIIILIAIWGGAYGMDTLTGLYAVAAYLTACLTFGLGIVIGLKGIK